MGSLPPSQVSFETVCTFMESLQRHRKSVSKRRRRIEKFIELTVDRECGDAFSIFRLVLPDLDRERGNYRLKEAALGSLLVQALGWERTDPRARGLLNHRDPGHAATAVGDLSLIAQQAGREGACLLQDDAPLEKRKELKVGDVNRKLDELAAAGDRAAKATVLRYFLQTATPRNLKWLVQIILKSARHGTGETVILNTWHEDAKAFFDARGQDLRAVFNTLTNVDAAYTSALELGKSARPQLASRVHSAAEALKKITEARGAAAGAGAPPPPLEADRPFLIETKFDGERIQVHRDGASVCYFSRRSIDHGERSAYDAMDGVVLAATGDHAQVILDGEMVAWNRRKQVMVPFGVLKRLFNAVRDGADPGTLIVSEEGIYYGGEEGGSEDLGARETQPWETQGAADADASGGFSRIQHRLGDLDLMYLAFDMLYDAGEGGSIADRPLGYRRARLAAAIPAAASVPVPNRSGVAIRLIPMVPDVTSIYPGGPLVSWTASTLAEVDAAVRAAQARREEGVILKRLDSPWSVNDRFSRSWLKIKPDYVARLDIDAVIVGGWYGEGARGGMVGQYLVALRGDPPPEVAAREGPDAAWFKTFCRVGTGLDEEERERLHGELMRRGLLQRGRHNRPPRLSTRSGAEVWVANPLNSVVLELNSDIRLIASAAYATDLSLRFPRITAVRYDKSPLECAVAEQLREKLRAQLTAEAEAGLAGRDRKRGQRGRGRRAGVRIVGPQRERDAAVAATPAEGAALAGLRLHVREGGGNATTAALCAVKAAGGVPAPNYTGAEAYVVAFAPLKPQKIRDLWKAKGGRWGKGRSEAFSPMGVVTPGWVEACRRSGTLCALRPRHLWHMGPRERGPTGEVDRYGAPYFTRATAADVEALASRHVAAAAPPGALAPAPLLQALLATSAPRRGGKPAPRPAVIGEEARGALEAAAEEAARLRRRGAEPGPRLLLPWLDAELEDRGALDRGGSVLHGCTLLLLETPAAEEGPDEAAGGGAGAGGAAPEQPPPFLLAGTLAAEAAAKTAAEAVRRLRLSQFRVKARLLGAAVVPEMGPHVTHVVGVTPAFLAAKPPSDGSKEPGAAPPAPFSVQSPEATAAAAAAAAGPAPPPSALLRAVEKRGGGAAGVAALRAALGAGEVALVGAAWVQECADVAATAAAAVAYLEGGASGQVQLDGGGRGSPGASLPLPQPEQLEPAADVAIERPDPGEFPLMDAEAMEDVEGWPWAEHGAPEAPRRLPPALAGGSAAREIKEAPMESVEPERAFPSRRAGAALQRRPKRPLASLTPSPAVAAPPPATRGRGRGRGRGRAAAPASEDVAMEEEPSLEAPLPQQRRGRALNGGRQASQTPSLGSQPFGSAASELYGSGSVADAALAPAAKAPRRGAAPARSQPRGPSAATPQSLPAGPPSRQQHSFAGLFDGPAATAVTAAGGGSQQPPAAAGAGPAAAQTQPSASGPPGPAHHQPAAALPSQAAPQAGGGGNGAAPPRMTLKQKMALDKLRREQQGQQ